MKVLVCMDSSIYASEILNMICRRSWQEGTRFLLISVLEVSGVADADNEMLHQAETILGDRVKNLAERLKQPCEVKGEVLEGRAESMINEAARDWCADLILIGSHGDTGIRKSGIGSVAAAVVNEAPCSVEVIKLKNERAQGKRNALATSAQN